jgi:hypothetical protein
MVNVIEEVERMERFGKIGISPKFYGAWLVPRDALPGWLQSAFNLDVSACTKILVTKTQRVKPLQTADIPKITSKSVKDLLDAIAEHKTIVFDMKLENMGLMPYSRLCIIDWGEVSRLGNEYFARQFAAKELKDLLRNASEPVKRILQNVLNKT